MSLDVYLYGEPEDRECSECGHVRPVRPAVFEANITHNLNRMAEAVGIYEHVWHPEWLGGIKKAGQLVCALEWGIEKLKKDPAYYRQFDSPNGWGTYDDFVPWLERYLEACRAYPDAEIGVSR